jgi:hypothetical protein
MIYKFNTILGNEKTFLNFFFSVLRNIYRMWRRETKRWGARRLPWKGLNHTTRDPFRSLVRVCSIF